MCEVYTQGSLIKTVWLEKKIQWVYMVIYMIKEDCQGCLKKQGLMVNTKWEVFLWQENVEKSVVLTMFLEREKYVRVSLKNIIKAIVTQSHLNFAQKYGVAFLKT